MERYTVLPGEQTLEKVDTGKKDDQVYLLQFKGQEKRRFFGCKNRIRNTRERVL